jgi:cephalosporin hydroxylase
LETIVNDFETEVKARISANGNNDSLRAAAKAFMEESIGAQYSYNFSALGRPIIQYPQDIVAIQELIWQTKPDLIIETGIAHGGSLILSASMLALLEYCEAIEKGVTLDPSKPQRRVLGIDIDIRAHNKRAIAAHPMSGRIEMIEGSSIDPAVVAQVQRQAKGFRRVMVCLDSNHTHDHVLGELMAYAPLVTLQSYCVVFDSIVEDLPPGSFGDRPWGRGNSPKTAVWEFLRRLSAGGVRAADGAPMKFEIDRSVENKVLLTAAPDGYLKRTA